MRSSFLWHSRWHPGNSSSFPGLNAACPSSLCRASGCCCYTRSAHSVRGAAGLAGSPFPGKGSSSVSGSSCTLPIFPCTGAEAGGMSSNGLQRCCKVWELLGSLSPCVTRSAVLRASAPALRVRLHVLSISRCSVSPCSAWCAAGSSGTILCTALVSVPLRSPGAVPDSCLPSHPLGALLCLVPVFPPSPASSSSGTSWAYFTEPGPSCV